MLSPERWIRIGLRRLRGRERILTLLGPLVAAIWCWSSLLLLSKLWQPEVLTVVLWSGIAVFPIAIAWGFQRPRSRFSRSDAAIWLDRELQTGGLIVALEEAPDSRWAALLPQQHQRWRESLPRWPVAKMIQALSWPVMFLIAALVIPARQPAQAAATETTLGLETARELTEMAAALDSLPLIAPGEKARLKSEIAGLADQARRAPLTHENWETVDAIRQLVQTRVGQADSELGQAGQILSLLSTAMEGGPQALNPEQQQQLEQQALGIVQKFATPENLSRLQGLSQEPAMREILQQGMTALPADPALRQELLKGLQHAVTGEARDLASLQKLLPAGDLSKSLSSLATSGALSTFLGGGIPFPGQVAPKASSKPQFGDDDRPAAARFRPQSGSPAVQQPRPEIRTAGPSVPAGPVTAGAKPTGEAWTRQVSPRHRAVVKQYFGAAAQPEPN